MKVAIAPRLNDANLDAYQISNQRQLAIALEAIAAPTDTSLPLNLCLILDRSGSMKGKPLENVKQAAISIVRKLTPQDRLSIVTFDHRANVAVANQLVTNPQEIERQIQSMKAEGGTAIDEGMKLGIKEIAVGKQQSISQVLLLTDGENEHGNNQRCLKLAQLAAEYNITLNTLGFGSHWNQDVLETIADSAGGTLSYIEKPEQALLEFGKLFQRIQAVGLTNAYLLLELPPRVRLAELKPIAQVSPDTIELPLQQDGNQISVRLGDLTIDKPKVVLANLYINKLDLGQQTIANLQVCYDDPATNLQVVMSEKIPVSINVQQQYRAATDDSVQKYVLALAKYRQTQIAEMKLQQGDVAGAATMLQTAAKTALQLGDKAGATVLQVSATRLQAGEALSDADRKKTRIVSKTILQD
jgi:Ca-activated chloride channel family protein